MMLTLTTAALLFAASFAAVFTLGIQQMNVERRHVLAAVATSPLIGLAHLALFKVLPGPTDWLEVAAYLAGGSAGIAAGIWTHPLLVELLSPRRVPLAQVVREQMAALVKSDVARRMQRAALEEAEAARQARAEHLGETLRLATQIADEAARSDIEINCSFERMGAHTWYDSASLGEERGPEIVDMVATALHYLHLRGRIVSHPTQPQLVRFEP